MALELESILNNLWQQIYPIGCIYQSTVSTSPATLFGGTWTQIKDRFLLSAGDLYSAGNTGGEATHILTIDEMPSHNHTFASRPLMWDSGYPNSVSQAGWGGAIQWGSTENTCGMNKAGKGKAHNNLPPYKVVYAWERTA